MVEGVVLTNVGEGHVPNFNRAAVTSNYGEMKDSLFFLTIASLRIWYEMPIPATSIDLVLTFERSFFIAATTSATRYRDAALPNPAVVNRYSFPFRVNFSK
jgi:hypothetical protein